MPETITLEDGSKREVQTAEEATQATTAAENAGKLKEHYDGLKATLGVKEGQKVEDRVKEMQESGDPNWAEVRGQLKVFENLKKSLEGQGKTINEDGTIVESATPMSSEDVTKTATDAGTKAAKAVTVKQTKDALTSALTEEQKKAVDVFYDKLAVGEDMDGAKVVEVVTQAMGLVGIAPPTAPAIPNMAPGSPPHIPQNSEESGDGFAETGAGEGLSSAMGLELSKAKEGGDK